MSHALALLAVAWAVARWPEARLELAGWLLIAGTVVFSGSLYLMALTGARWLGAITPIGGVLLIAGWTVLAWRTARRPRPADTLEVVSSYGEAALAPDRNRGIEDHQ